MGFAYTIQLLQTFGPNEWLEMQTFLDSPFSHTTPLARQLYCQIREKRAVLDAVSPTSFQEELGEALWPGEAFKPQRLRRVMMELKREIKSYLIHRSAARKNWLAREAVHLRYLLDCGAYALFEKALRKVDRRLSQPTAQSADAQYLVAEIRRMENEFLIHSSAAKDSFDAVGEAVDRHFLASKLENWASMLTREKRYSQKHQFHFRTEIESMLEKAPLEDWPEVKIWSQVVALESPNSQRIDFDRLQDSLDAFSQLLPLEKLRQVRGYMFNFLIRHLRSERKEDYRELWNLLRTMQGEGVLLLGGRLSAPFLRAAVQSACFAGEAAWAEHFLEEMGPLLVGPERVRVLSLHRLTVAYHLGRHHEVLRGSAVLRHGNPRYEILLRVLQLKSHFDLGNGEDFLRLAAAFRKLMRRKSGIGERFVEGYSEFGRMAEWLGKAKFGDKRSGEKLRKEILDSKAGERSWLLEKAAALPE